jgi:hypothetical protein
MYAEASFRSEICSQAVLWEELIILDRKNGFFKVKAEDGYLGWIEENQLVRRRSSDTPPLRMVTAQLVAFGTGPEPGGTSIRSVSAGGYLKVTAEENGGFSVEFPDGKTGWTGETGIFDRPALSRSEIASLAFTYLGMPYMWGGKTPPYLDCSGFVQLIHKLFGISIPRDARDQFAAARKATDDPHEARKGDLLFFSEGGTVSHVALSAGDGTVLHSRGMVTVNSMRPGHELFRGRLLDTFAGVGTFLDEDL